MFSCLWWLLMRLTFNSKKRVSSGRLGRNRILGSVELVELVRSRLEHLSLGLGKICRRAGEVLTWSWISNLDLNQKNEFCLLQKQLDVCLRTGLHYDRVSKLELGTWDSSSIAIQFPAQITNSELQQFWFHLESHGSGHQKAVTK